MEFFKELIDYRAVVEIILLIAVAVGTYFKITGFRRSNPGNPNNPGNPGNNKTQMTKDITETKTRVEILEHNQDTLFTKVDKIGEDVSFIRGQMEG